MTVRVVAQQWAWSFVHPGADNKLDTSDDIKTVDELHVKVGQTYHFKLESRDVLHSFSVPVFRLKQDVIPGRIITGWFTPTRVGVHDIQCAEICGIGHALMPARIYIHSQSDYDAWEAKNTVPTATASGADGRPHRNLAPAVPEPNTITPRGGSWRSRSSRTASGQLRLLVDHKIIAMQYSSRAGDGKSLGVLSYVFRCRWPSRPQRTGYGVVAPNDYTADHEPGTS